MKQKLNEYITSKEAAEFLGVHPNTLKNWARKKKIAFYTSPMNKWYMFKKSDLEKILERIKSGQPK